MRLRRARTPLLLIGIAAAAAIVLIPRAWLTANDVTTGAAPAYPDLRDRLYDMPPDQTLQVAAAVAGRIPRWKVVSTDRAGGVVHVEIRTALPFFTDDLTVHVHPEGRNSRVTIRSRSRVGRGDLGENARHIRALQAAMDSKLPQVR
jgi:uncharacterized protein (DUF1499 family)